MLTLKSRPPGTGLMHKQNRTLNTLIGRAPLKDLCGHSARNVAKG
jgi:hypothetical protein